MSIDEPTSRHNGFNPSTIILRKGHKKDADCRAFSVDTVFERDMKVLMRVGVDLYADEFRPVDEHHK